MQTNTRLFQNDMKTTNGSRNEPIKKPIQREPETIQTKGNSLFESTEYRDLALERANENARLIKDRTNKEIHEIRNHIERLKAEYEIDASLIDDRIEKKQNSLSRLKSMLASIEEDTSGSDPISGDADDLYKSINQQTKKLSILTAVLDDFLGNKQLV